MKQCSVNAGVDGKSVCARSVEPSTPPSGDMQKASARMKGKGVFSGSGCSRDCSPDSHVNEYWSCVSSDGMSEAGLQRTWRAHGQTATTRCCRKAIAATLSPATDVHSCLPALASVSYYFRSLEGRRQGALEAATVHGGAIFYFSRVIDGVAGE